MERKAMTLNINHLHFWDTLRFAVKLAYWLLRQCPYFQYRFKWTP